MNETQEYKGHMLQIEQDPAAMSPSDWGNTGAFLCGWHDRHFWRPPPGMEEVRDPQYWIDEHRDTHWIFPLEAYIHGGVALALEGEGSFPDRMWDVSSNMGAVFLSKEEWKTRKANRTRAAARALVEEWNQYLSGDVWGFIVEHVPSGWEDSCWGFYGKDYCEQEAKSVIDGHVNELRKERIKRVKEWIRNRVPLHVREREAIEDYPLYTV